MKTIPFLLSILPVLSIAQQKFEITGKVEGLSDKEVVSITDPNTPSDTLAKGKVTNGKFVLTGVINEPVLKHLNFSVAQKKVLLFLSPDKISVEGKAAYIQNLAVEGSAAHDDFVAFQQTFNPIFEKISKSNQNNTTSFTQEEYESLQNKLDSFLAVKKSSYVSPFVLLVTAQLSQDITLLEKRYTALDPKVQQSFFGSYIKKAIDDGKIGEVGTEAANFTQNDTSGKPVSLSSYRGKYVLIDFWASWCRPCRMENPNVVNAYNKFKDKNFTVLGVSLDRSKDAWLKAIKDDNLTWTQVSDLKYWSNEVAVMYKVQGIPQNFLVGPDGKIVAKNLRGPELEIKLCELLGGCN